MSRNFKILTSTLLAIVTVIVTSSFVSNASKKLSNQEKWMSQTWKMWKVEKNGNEVEPKFSRFILKMKKNKTFVITSEYEMTHRGTWSYKNKTLTLNDKVTNRSFVLPVKDLDETHLSFENYEGKERTTFLTPVTSKDAIHLNHKEHLMAKKWRIYNSTKDRNIGAFYEFHEDKTFIYIPAGMSIPASSGKWTLSDDGKTVTLEIKRTKEQFTLAVEELHRHALTLKNIETGTTNYLHDEFLTQKDQVKEEKEAAEAVEETIEK